MRYRFLKKWQDYKVGDRVPASVNRNYLLRSGIIARYSYVQEATDEAQEAEAKPPTEPNGVTVDDVLNVGKKGKR